jgi:hypothetical protein
VALQETSSGQDAEWQAGGGSRHGEERRLVLAARKLTVIRGAQMVLDQVDLGMDEASRLGSCSRRLE